MAFDDTPEESSLSLSKKIMYSIIGGIFITLGTSILPNNTVIGASNFGYPFPWLSQPLYPIGSLPTLIWSAVIIDIGVWSLVSFVVVILYNFFKSR
jgi:hypothetical protein